MTNPRYWREISQRYALKGNRCTNCEEPYFPPRGICPNCRRDSVGKMEVQTFSGRGKLVTYSVVHDGPPGMEAITPYAIAIVELEEGPRITSQVVDIDVDGDELEIGMPVRMVFRKMGEEGSSGAIHYGYKFKPALDGA